MSIRQGQYDSQSLRSNNLYQNFTYVKNQDANHTGDVAVMPLYAKTEEAITPDCEFQMSGNRISVKTLDLHTDFVGIAAQLDEIVGRILAKAKRSGYSGERGSKFALLLWRDNEQQMKMEV